MWEVAPELLTRDVFRARALERDGGKCVLCGEAATEVHHIVDRRLFEDGGYYEANAASVCNPCHRACERTLISCEEVRAAAGIRSVRLPDHLYNDETRYTKWGDPILPNGSRLRGELFFDASVQKVLAEGDVLRLYQPYTKPPRTFHAPWSPGRTKDDKIQRDLSHLQGREVVATVKMDGENTSLYRDYLHARSLEYAPRVDRDRMKALHAGLAADIPEGWRVTGENAWACHSIAYRNLPHFFMVFGVWNERNQCLSWDETVEWAGLLGLPTVPVLYRGPWDEALLRKLHQPTHNGEDCEGYVVRDVESFPLAQFSRKLVKYVRAGHLATQAHWTRKIVPNGFTL